MLSTPDRLQFFAFLDAAVGLAKDSDADGILVLMDYSVDWKELKLQAGETIPLIVATNSDSIHKAVVEHEIASILLERPESSVQNQVTQALLASVANDLIPSGSTIATIYGLFDHDVVDTVSLLKLTERLGRLTASDLRKLKTDVPLETLKTVVDLAVSIGREGREGKAIGTMFVVGDHRKVLKHSRASGFDITKGYTRKERNILDQKIHENIKELAQLDGTFVVAADGTIEGCARIIDTPPVEVTMTRGLGTRHFAAAAISKNTDSVAVVVSQSGGTVRIYQDGEVVLRIEPLQRAMKWKVAETDESSDEE